MIISSRSQTNQAGTPSQGPQPAQGPSQAAGRLQGGSSTLSSPSSPDDISGLSFDEGGGHDWSAALGGCYVPHDDGHGKFTPCPRTPPTHSVPGDHHHHRHHHDS